MPAMPRTLTTDSVRNQCGLEKATSHSPPRISVVIGTTTDMLRLWSGFEIETTTQGRTFCVTPKSTMTTSPRLKLVIIDLWSWTEFFPRVRDNFTHSWHWRQHRQAIG